VVHLARIQGFFLKSYYQILELEPTCSPSEIKKAFRQKAKTFHPDLKPSGKNAAMMRRIIAAYKVLSDPERRADYDRTHKNLIYESDFDYRDFLSGRRDDPLSLAKLLFFDLLHGHEAEAVALYDRLVSEDAFDLSVHLDREDFMDCAFLLAEEYENAGEYDKAFILLRRIVDYELENPYFRHFFREVIDRLRRLCCVKLSGVIDNVDLVAYLEDLVELDFSDKDSAAFLKKIAEIYVEENSYDLAREYLNHGLKLHAKLPGAKKLSERLA
jgi:tetratricopeptide (TPR) repeat protein